MLVVRAVSEGHTFNWETMDVSHTVCMYVCMLNVRGIWTDVFMYVIMLFLCALCVWDIHLAWKPWIYSTRYVCVRVCVYVYACMLYVRDVWKLWM
jgi:hypothetical protein